MKETTFESPPAHVGVVVGTPVGLVTVVVPVCGGLSTITCNVPTFAMSAAGMVAVNCWLLTKVVANEEPFKYTIEVVRKSFPLMVNVNWPLPAVALLGEMEATDGAGGQAQDVAVASAIKSTYKTGDLAGITIGAHLQQTGSDTWGAAKLKAIEQEPAGLAGLTARPPDADIIRRACKAKLWGQVSDFSPSKQARCKLGRGLPTQAWCWPEWGCKGA